MSKIKCIHNPIWLSYPRWALEAPKRNFSSSYSFLPLFCKGAKNQGKDRKVGSRRGKEKQSKQLWGWKFNNQSSNNRVKNVKLFGRFQKADILKNLRVCFKYIPLYKSLMSDWLISQFPLLGKVEKRQNLAILSSKI